MATSLLTDIDILNDFYRTVLYSTLRYGVYTQEEADQIKKQIHSIEYVGQNFDLTYWCTRPQ